MCDNFVCVSNSNLRSDISFHLSGTVAELTSIHPDITFSNTKGYTKLTINKIYTTKTMEFQIVKDNIADAVITSPVSTTKHEIDISNKTDIVIKFGTQVNYQPNIDIELVFS